jgi:regulator of sigma E protease
MTVLIFVGTILVLVGVHELGHFLLARAFGVYVWEFAIGIGPVLLSKKGKETKYSIRLLPIGGYVRMAGEDRLETSGTVPPDRTLYSKPPYVRALISVAGALSNILLAFVVTLGVVWASQLPLLQVADVIPGAPAAAILRVGDRIITVDDRTIYTLDQLTAAVQSSDGSAVRIDLLRDGEPVTVTVVPRRAVEDDRYEVGAYFLSVAFTNEVRTLDPTSPLSVVGVLPGDRIVEVDGQPVTTGVGFLVALEDALAVASEGVSVRLLRGGESIDLVLPSDGRSAEEFLVGLELADLGVDTHRPSLLSGFSLAATQFSTYVRLLGQTVRGLIVGSVAARDAIQGPVGIATTIRQGLNLGFGVFLQILAFLSLNFGLINLIPFPALDGSRVVFAVYEWARGKPIPPDREGIIHAIGFLVLIGLMILITYQDIVRLFR